MSETPEKPKPRKNGRPSKHGYRRARDTLYSRGLAALDQRSALARSLKALRADIESDLGGDLSATKQCVVENALRSQALLEHVDGFLFGELEQGRSLVNQDDWKVRRIVSDRMSIADSVLRQLQAIGLDRQKTSDVLDSYCESTFGETPSTASSSTSAVSPEANGNGAADADTASEEGS